MNLIGFVADAWILATYALLARTGRPWPFHLANAIGCIPIIAVEFAAGAYVPLVLTVAFGAIGWIGLLRTRTGALRHVPVAISTCDPDGYHVFGPWGPPYDVTGDYRRWQERRCTLGENCRAGEWRPSIVEGDTA